MQRVALARSLVYRPQLLLLDEPLSNLDAKLRIRLRDELRRILKMTGMTGLYVTHDQAEAVVLGDRIGVMRDGKLLQMAPPGEIYNRPADSFVANFTGASNVLLGKVLARSGERATIDLGAAGRIEAWTPQPLSRRRQGARGLARRERAAGRRGPANVFSGRVLERRYQGMQTVYDVELGGQRLEALELGTAARHEQNGEIAITLPPDTCWAYRDEGATRRLRPSGRRPRPPREPAPRRRPRDRPRRRSRADQRGEPEQPELLERPAAGEQRRPGAARRIHRGVGHRDADRWIRSGKGRWRSARSLAAVHGSRPGSRTGSRRSSRPRRRSPPASE